MLQFWRPLIGCPRPLTGVFETSGLAVTLGDGEGSWTMVIDKTAIIIIIII
jgi:hypothetical protein